MSAEVLRRAAEELRGRIGSPFLLAVADWLDATAAEHEADAAAPERVRQFFAAFDTAPDRAALAVARAYLGESS